MNAKLMLLATISVSTLATVCLCVRGAEAKSELKTMIRIPFRLHDKSGSIAVASGPNEDPERLGFGILSPEKLSLAGIIGFPVVTAKVSYEGEGYKTAMGWIQFITYSQASDESAKTLLDQPPQLVNSNAPYFAWGSEPTLFDAPAMLADDRKPKPNVTWRADSFLVASSDGVMTKTISAIASFSWGYKTDSDKKIAILEAKDTRLGDWDRFSKILQARFPGWTFKASK